jgi:hypothetical protein
MFVEERISNLENKVDKIEKAVERIGKALEKIINEKPGKDPRQSTLQKNKKPFDFLIGCQDGLDKITEQMMWGDFVDAVEAPSGLLMGHATQLCYPPHNNKPVDGEKLKKVWKLYCIKRGW